jgi:hypothetical protein
MYVSTAVEWWRLCVFGPRSGCQWWGRRHQAGETEEHQRPRSSSSPAAQLVSDGQLPVTTTPGYPAHPAQSMFVHR